MRCVVIFSQPTDKGNDPAILLLDGKPFGEINGKPRVDSGLGKGMLIGSNGELIKKTGIIGTIRAWLLIRLRSPVCAIEVKRYALLVRLKLVGERGIIQIVVCPLPGSEIP